MSGFTKGQVVLVRRYEAAKFFKAWYLAPEGSSSHLVNIEGGSTAVISDDNIQAHADNIKLDTEAFVFRTSNGTYSIVTCQDNKSGIADTFRNFPGYKLIGLIDLSQFNISFPEGHGLMPAKGGTP